MRLMKERFKKPQNQISERVKESAICELRDWLKGFDMPGYHARLLASELVDRAITQQLDKTSDASPDVFISDSDKQLRIVMSGRKIAAALDEEEKLETLLADLCLVDSRHEGNS